MANAHRVKNSIFSSTWPGGIETYVTARALWMIIQWPHHDNQDEARRSSTASMGPCAIILELVIGIVI